MAPNTTHNEQMAFDGLPVLKARTDLEALRTDGSYDGPDLETLLRQYRIEHIPTNVCGRRPSPDRLGLDAFSWETDEAAVLLAMGCPDAQRVEVRAGRKTGRFLANSDQTACETCPLADQCPTKTLKRRWRGCYVCVLARCKSHGYVSGLPKHGERATTGELPRKARSGV